MQTLFIRKRYTKEKLIIMTVNCCVWACLKSLWCNFMRAIVCISNSKIFIRKPDFASPYTTVWAKVLCFFAWRSKIREIKICIKKFKLNSWTHRYKIRSVVNTIIVFLWETIHQRSVIRYVTSFKVHG